MYHFETLFSLIIPVYNVAPYLERCLNSCMDQDFKKYEIVCIDDGSTDESGVILDKYHEKYKDRIRVIHSENKGVSEARNCGIRNSTGQFCWFIDPDDTIESRILEDLSRIINETDIVLLPFAEIDEQSGKKKVIDWRCSDYEKSDTFNEIVARNRFDKVWNYIVRKSVITENELFFGKGIILGEDRAFDFFLRQHIEKWVIFDKVSYYYFIRSESASKGLVHDDKYFRRMIENAYCTAFYYNEMRKKYSDKESDFKVQQLQSENVRYVINNSVKYGDVVFLKQYIGNLKAINMYPCPGQNMIQKEHSIHNTLCSLFNVPVIAELFCRLYGIKKRIS